MGDVLAEYESSSGRKTYQILLGRDGVTYCNCPAWRFSKDRPRTCKHLDKYFAGKVQEHRPQAVEEDPVYDDGSVEQSVEQAIRELKG